MLNCIHDSLYLRSSLAPAVTHVTHGCLGVNQLAVQHNLDTWRAQVRAEERENFAGSAHLKVARAARILNITYYRMHAGLITMNKPEAIAT